jgi:uncharacterized protein (TIGR00369 family)
VTETAFVRTEAELTELRRWFNELPILQLLSARCIQLEVGRATLELAPGGDLANPNGAITGALIAGAIDLAAGVAVTSSGPVTEYASTTDLTVHFLAAARAAPMTFQATLLRRGRRNCVVEIRGHDGAGMLCVTATGTWALAPDSPHAGRREQQASQ